MTTPNPKVLKRRQGLFMERLHCAAPTTPAAIGRFSQTAGCFSQARRYVARMDHYSYPKTLKTIWEGAVAKYEAGNREPDSYFDEATRAELASVGLNTMDIYDYAEDYVSHGEPDFETFLLVCAARRDYFLAVQEGQPSEQVIAPEALPPKDAEIKGVVWLPRIIPKAYAKLKGELPPETMYGCGGDRKFFKANKIHPADFLRAAWAHEDDESKLIDWVLARKSS